MTTTTDQAARRLTYVQAFNEVFAQEMDRDPNVIILGEDIAGGATRPEFEDAWGGPFKLTKGLYKKFGPERILDTPIAENGFIGAGLRM